MPSSLWSRLLPGKQWRLLAGKIPGLPDNFSNLSALRPPWGRSWADPFPVMKDGRCWLFIEEVVHHPKKGRLAVMELHADGKTGPLKVILDRPYHLSYPNLFEYDGEWWMIPESRANRTVDLYRCTRWPDHWVHERALFRGEEIVDATLWEQDGRWWLFGGVPALEGGNASSQLNLWTADSPLSREWVPHPGNPIVSDNACARPAGRLFRHEGQLIRPAQDCSVRYGYGVRLMAVEELTMTTYREREFKAYRPNFAPGLIATHTLNRAGEWLLGDAAARAWPN
ncbi:glucosamine inositolphosphorylceramide transferase family protein [Cerasicoccus arenae]|uniref:Glucosamine inositolphosphorylceramide transferase 1 N-terminal domain-containing protein n=1 Tax=Cerasicoccus arenae TaxID=424488 RepID=A0A8J3DAV6_9BACT|nr:hypothetical protein [Cerasicoccus arenae]MBK1858139.1 hypothetical protein [Cerasicoccus arenae]GHB96735.1 hypothetical protein GCM10007047_10820 [Cerasicoccus arenae]